MALLVLSVVRVFAFPFIEPANKFDPPFWLEVYNFSILLWIPALAVLALAGFLQLRRWLIRLIERR